MQRRHIFNLLAFAVFFVFIFVYNWSKTGQWYWPIIGVAVLFLPLYFFSSTRPIQKIIGECPPIRRTPFIKNSSWFLALVLTFPFFLYLIDQLSKPEPDWKNFAVFIIIPILLGVSVEILRIPEITEKTKSNIISVIKKMALSTSLFVIFIPFFILTNKYQISINSTPDFYHPISWFYGFVVWAMVFCFYVGLFLFIFGLIDFIFFTKNISIRRYRKKYYRHKR